MSDYSGLGDLVDQVKVATQHIKRADDVFNQRLDSAEKCISELYRKTSRPGGFSAEPSATDERKDAVEMCRVRHSTLVAKHEDVDYVPAHREVDEAITAQKALSQYLRHGNLDRLAPESRKSLPAFSFGPPGHMLLPPTQASRILSCLVSPTDLSGLLDQVTIAGLRWNF